MKKICVDWSLATESEPRAGTNWPTCGIPGRLLSTIVAIASLTVLAHADTDWHQWSGNGHWYKAVSVSGTISWGDAQAQSLFQGGYLATLTSAEENAFVSPLVAAPEYWVQWSGVAFGPYLGGYATQPRDTPRASWHWVTGETWDYTNWHPGEPSNGGPAHNENVLQFALHPSFPTSSYYWNDVNDSGASTNAGGGVRSYIIEREIQPVPEPASLLVLGLGALVARRKKKTAS